MGLLEMPHIQSSLTSVLDDSQALQKALELGFSTKSNPHNRGFGVDTILTIVKANKGEITIVSNRAFYSKQIKSRNVKSEADNLAFSFPGTYLVIKLNTTHENPQNLPE